MDNKNFLDDLARIKKTRIPKENIPSWHNLIVLLGVSLICFPIGFIAGISFLELLQISANTISIIIVVAMLLIIQPLVHIESNYLWKNVTALRYGNQVIEGPITLTLYAGGVCALWLSYKTPDKVHLVAVFLGDILN